MGLLFAFLILDVCLQILEMDLCSYEEDTYFTNRGNSLVVPLTDKSIAYALLVFHRTCTFSDTED